MAYNKYITEKPDFEDLASLRDDVKHVYQMLSALADCTNDISQRAVDLLVSVKELSVSANVLLLIEEDDDDTNEE